MIGRISNMLSRRALKFSNAWAAKFWHENPFTSAPMATADQYQKLWKAEAANTYPSIDELEKSYGHAVDKAWMDDLALHTQIVIKTSPLCYQHGRILYAVLSDFLAKRPKKSPPITIFETGTARGFSATVMAKAMQVSNQSGRIVTFDILPHDKKIYWNCIDDHEGKKSRSDLLAPWQDLIAPYIMFIEGDSRINLGKVQAERIEFAFLDGAHSYHDVTFEFERVAAYQQAGDIIVFDDYNTSDFAGLVRAVDDGCVRMGYDKKVITAKGDRRYVIATKM